MKILEEKSIRHKFPKTINYKGHVYAKIRLSTKLKDGDIFPTGFEDREWNRENNYPYQDDIGTPLYRRRKTHGQKLKKKSSGNTPRRITNRQKEMSKGR